MEQDFQKRTAKGILYKYFTQAHVKNPHETRYNEDNEMKNKHIAHNTEQNNTFRTQNDA